MTTTVPAQQYDHAVAEVAALRDQLAAAQRQLAAAERRIAWFKRQLFGAKSEKRRAIDPAVQASLFAGLIEDAPPADLAVGEIIATHTAPSVWPSAGRALKCWNIGRR